MWKRYAKTPPIELPLTDLSTDPDSVSVERMLAFDRLARPLQRALDAAPFQFPPAKVLDYQARNGASAALNQVRRSIVAERDRFERERDAALAWAGRVFGARK